jgi:hypothetical protein
MLVYAPVQGKVVFLAPSFLLLYMYHGGRPTGHKAAASKGSGHNRGQTTPYIYCGGWKYCQLVSSRADVRTISTCHARWCHNKDFDLLVWSNIKYFLFKGKKVNGLEARENGYLLHQGATRTLNILLGIRQPQLPFPRQLLSVTEQFWRLESRSGHE